MKPLLLILPLLIGCQKQYTTEQRRASMEGAVVPVTQIVEVK